MLQLFRSSLCAATRTAGSSRNRCSSLFAATAVLVAVFIAAIADVSYAFTSSSSTRVAHDSLTTTTICQSFLPCSLSLQTTRRTTSTPLHAAATSINEITTESSEKMSKSVESVKMSLTSIRTGRASASILDRVKVDYYGASTPLNQLASISVPSAQQLAIDPYDKKSLNDIEKAIVLADIGLTPSNDGNIIRINIPSLTEDRRKDLLKQCKSIGEEGKVAIRNIRRDGVDTIKKMEKAGTIGEDEMKDGTDKMQKMTDQSVKEIDEIVSKKEKEVMTV